MRIVVTLKEGEAIAVVGAIEGEDMPAVDNSVPLAFDSVGTALALPGWKVDG